MNKLLQREIYRKKVFRNEFFIKEFSYHYPHPELTLNRLKLFEEIQKFQIFPNSSLSIGRKNIILKQKKIEQGKLSTISIDDAIKMSQLFISKVQNLWRLGFVHGDINRRNIFCSEGRLGLFDFEPYLTLEKDGAKKLIATNPYICLNDLKKQELTQASDMIGLACFINWFCFDRATSPINFYRLTLRQNPEVVIKKTFSKLKC